MSRHVNIYRENAVLTLTTARPEKTKAHHQRDVRILRHRALAKLPAGSLKQGSDAQPRRRSGSIGT